MLQHYVPSLNDCRMSHLFRLAPSWFLRCLSSRVTRERVFAEPADPFLGLLLLFPKLPKLSSHPLPAVTGGDQERESSVLHLQLPFRIPRPNATYTPLKPCTKKIIMGTDVA